MRELTTHKVPGGDDFDNTTVRALDGEPGVPATEYSIGADDELLALIHCQKGTLRATGCNGVTDAHLLAIVADRLQARQCGHRKNKFHATALGHVQTALAALQMHSIENQQRVAAGCAEE